MSFFGKIFDIFGNGGNNKFYARDFRNAYTFRPDQTPPRQKFQGYVNFVVNRSLYAETWYTEGGSALRSQIGSLVRTASLPELEFKTEIKNSYNRKRIVNTGVEYQPIDIKVFDTINNEWLTLFMKYFSYHYMNPKNKNNANRDIVGSELDDSDIRASEFGPGSDWESNEYGYNLNLISNFFERIDYVLYHGNKGVQYSLTNPVMTRFRTGEIDYASSDVMEFDMTFEYESFTIHENVNFDLSTFDLSRFENARNFTGPAFVPGEKPITLKENAITLLTGERTAQPQIVLPGVDIVVSSTSVFGEPDVISGPTEKDKSFLGGLLAAVADNALSAAIHGTSIKNAVVSTAVGGVIQGITDVVQTPVRPSKSQPTETPGSSQEAPPVTPGSGG
jgi:hypothetical protein